VGKLTRRAFIAHTAALLAAPYALAQQQRGNLFSYLRKEGPAELPPEALAQRVYDSPAPAARSGSTAKPAAAKKRAKRGAKPAPAAKPATKARRKAA